MKRWWNPMTLILSHVISSYITFTVVAVVFLVTEPVDFQLFFCLLLAPAVVPFLAILGAAYCLDGRKPSWRFLLFALLYSVVFIARTIYAQRHIRRAHRLEAGLCSNCGYNLAGNTSGVCPECGARVLSRE